MTRVLPGFFLSENKSSEVMRNFYTFTNYSGIYGRVPTAITMYLEVTVTMSPFLFFNEMVCLSTKVA